MSRAIVLLVILSVIAAASAQSLCDKYASILSVSGATLIGVAVNGTVASVVANPVTARYFDGSLAPYQTPNAINYSAPANVGALNHLITNLDTFFYAALNCTDRTLGPYTGRDMRSSHAALPIGPVQFESFNRQLLAVLASKGVTMADQMTILGVLNSLKPQICNQPACNNVPATASICDRYSAALNVTEYDLMDTVVVAVIANVTSPSSPLKKFFDGTIPGTTNFLAPNNAGALAALRAHLDQFFGAPGVLNCSAPNFPAYQGRSLAASHANLQIDVASFNLFNTVVLNIMTGAGVAAADTNAVNAVLQSTQGSIVTVSNTTTGATTRGATTTGAGATGTTTGARVVTTTTRSATNTNTAGSTSTTSAAPATVFNYVSSVVVVLASVAVYLF